MNNGAPQPDSPPSNSPTAGSLAPAALTIGVLDSGLGLLTFADALLRTGAPMRLVLAVDPDFFPYGALSTQVLTERVLYSAQTLVAAGAQALVVACNTASVYALAALRERYEPSVPVIGTVPAIRPAARLRQPFAVWATEATTASPYQAELIEQFADPELIGGGGVQRIACADLVPAIEAADAERIRAAAEQAAALTAPSAQAVVLGCTHFGLVADEIRAAFVRVRGTAPRLIDTPDAVAGQALRRLGFERPGGSADGPEGRVLAVFNSGRPGELPAAAHAYAAGQRLVASGPR